MKTKSIRKWLSILIILAMSLSLFAACRKKDETESSDSSKVEQDKTDDVAKEDDTNLDTVEEGPTLTPIPDLDLGGMEIIIGDWWSSDEEKEPTTAQEEATQEYRRMIQEKYNFKMKQVAVSDWNGMQETFTTSVMAEDPAAEIMLLGPAWTAQPLANGLFYDLATLEHLDFTDSKWNQAVLEQMTYGDSIFGMASGKPEPKLGVYFNKRLFKEAGLDPDLPYDLQASGDWTWDKFEELCEELLIDHNNDGVIDTYPMMSFSAELIPGAITANNGKFVGKDENGKFYNAIHEPQFIEALQWVVKLISKGYEMRSPEGAQWDYFTTAFMQAEVAMIAREQYWAGDLQDMEDDWGFVLFPKPDKESNYRIYFSDNVAVIPSCFDEETANKIAFAYNLWTNPTPGYEGDDDWKQRYYPMYRDERAVDETLAMMYDVCDVVYNYQPFVYGIDTGADMIWDIYGLWATPAEKIEEVSGKWDALIEEANANIEKLTNK